MFRSFRGEDLPEVSSRVSCLIECHTYLQCIIGRFVKGKPRILQNEIQMLRIQGLKICNQMPCPAHGVA